MAEETTPPEHLLTPAEVAALVFVDPKTVSRWAQAGKIPSVRTPGGHRRFRASDVQAILRRDRSKDQLHHETGSPLLTNGGVEQEVARRAAESARVQRLAVRVGVVTATLGAVLGGFAGTVAARVVGI
jgi:excisionase family DNA binding protein